jgi:hypothetical protein
MTRNRDPRDDPPRVRYRAPPGPIATLGQLRRTTCWKWLYCNASACQRGVPAALAPFIIRLGADVRNQ